MYTIKYLLKQSASLISRVNIFEQIEKPYGLVRYGVAPDHPEVKEVSKEFATLLQNHSSVLKMNLRHRIMSAVDFGELCDAHDAVLVATGAQGASRLPFSHLPSSTMPARDFVLWYNGHPGYGKLDLPAKPLDVVVVGHGNVALDVARILSKSEDELLPLLRSGLLDPGAFEWLVSRQQQSGTKTVSILGRRGYMAAAFTNKEFRELTTMKSALCLVDSRELELPLEKLWEKSQGNRAKLRGLTILETCIENNHSSRSVDNVIKLRFGCKPLSYAGDPVSGINVSHVNSSEELIKCQLGIESIGFKVSNDFGLPINAETGGIAHDGHGRVVGLEKVYVAGWAKRGPRGVIAANIPCCIETAEAMHADLLG